MFKIDGTEWDVAVTSFKRNYSALDRDDSGRSTTTGAMIRSVIGSFFNFELEINSRNLNQEQYDELYDIITSDDEFHDFEFPFGQQDYAFVGYIANASDELKRVEKSGKRKFTNLTFNVVPKNRKVR